MSPRPKRKRIMLEPPFVSGFVPEGVDYNSTEVIVLHFEEYEAIKLADYDNLTHLEASAKLGVSRPTFTRIYDSARKKIAQSFIENKRIVIQGGSVEFASSWFRCNNCGSVFKQGEKQGAGTQKCPVCDSQDVILVQDDKGVQSGEASSTSGFGRQHRGGRGPQGFCVCPKCDYRIPHRAGIPCNSNLCPHCDIRMVKEGSEHYQQILNKRKT